MPRIEELLCDCHLVSFERKVSVMKLHFNELGGNKQHFESFPISSLLQGFPWLLRN